MDWCYDNPVAAVLPVPSPVALLQPSTVLDVVATPVPVADLVTTVTTPNPATPLALAVTPVSAPVPDYLSPAPPLLSSLGPTPSPVTALQVPTLLDVVAAPVPVTNSVATVSTPTPVPASVFAHLLPVTPFLSSLGSTPSCPAALTSLLPAAQLSPLVGFEQELKVEPKRDNNGSLATLDPVEFNFCLPPGAPIPPTGFGEEATLPTSPLAGLEEKLEAELMRLAGGSPAEPLPNNFAFGFCPPASAPAPPTGFGFGEKVSMPAPPHLAGLEEELEAQLLGYGEDSLAAAAPDQFTFGFSLPAGAPTAPTGFWFGDKVAPPAPALLPGLEEELEAQLPREEEEELPAVPKNFAFGFCLPADAPAPPTGFGFGEKVYLPEPVPAVTEANQRQEVEKAQASGFFYDAPCPLSDELPGSSDGELDAEDGVIPLGSIPNHFMVTQALPPTDPRKYRGRW